VGSRAEALDRRVRAAWRGRAVRAAGGIVIVLALRLLAAAGAVGVAPAATSMSSAVTVSASPSAGSVPLIVTFTATVSPGAPSDVAWTFGDGASWNGTAPAGLSVVHRYVTVGAFTAIARVNVGGVWSQGSTTVAVQNGPLVAAVSATPASGTAPLTILFRAVVSGGTGTYTSFNWAFGDTGFGSGPVVQYAYRTAGHFTITLAVTDSANVTALGTFAVDVANSSAPQGPTNPFAGLGPATLATAGIVGAGLTWGVLYAGRRRRLHRDRSDDDPADVGALPPGVFGPAPTAPLAAAPASSESSGSTASISEPSVAAASRYTSSVAPPTSGGEPGASMAVALATRPARPAGTEPRRWSRDIVAYLGALPTLGPDDIPTIDWTQKGMSDRLGTGQNQVSNVLRRLAASGLVVEELQHVQGQPRRLKVYRLSLRGEALARELRRRHPATNPNFLRRDW